MKIRRGFVSNSSSSSFIIAYKGEDKLNDAALTNIFGVSESSPIHGFVRELASTMIDLANPVSAKSIEYDHCESPEEAAQNGSKEAQLFLKGYNVLKGWASNEAGEIETAIYNMSIKYESDDFVLLVGYDY